MKSSAIKEYLDPKLTAIFSSNNIHFLPQNEQKSITEKKYEHNVKSRSKSSLARPNKESIVSLCKKEYDSSEMLRIDNKRLKEEYEQLKKELKLNESVSYIKATSEHITKLEYNILYKEYEKVRQQLKEKDEFYGKKLKLIEKEIAVIKEKEKELAEINVRAQNRLMPIDADSLYLESILNELIDLGKDYLYVSNPKGMKSNEKKNYLKTLFNNLINDKNDTEQKLTQLLYLHNELKKGREENSKIIQEQTEENHRLKDQLKQLHNQYKYV